MARFTVIGLGKFGMTVATTLYSNGAEVVAVDKDEKLTIEVKGRVSTAINMDSTDEASLKELSIHEMDAVILAVGNNVEVSVLTSVLLKKLGAPRIYAKVNSKLHGRILELIGINNIVFPEEERGSQLAKSLLTSNVLQYMKLSSGHSVVELRAPREWIGQTLQQLALPRDNGVHIIGIKSEQFTTNESGENILEPFTNDMPGANDVVGEGDVMILLGSENNIDNLIKETAKDMGKL
ncbi:MAG: TrkA family potassium uptake protein [Candidatus Cloacimonetes bacterium]|nr:TrkA family potassium uptake protein [Candidatus Cloacimonadota bacterium]